MERPLCSKVHVLFNLLGVMTQNQSTSVVSGNQEKQYMYMYYTVIFVLQKYMDNYANVCVHPFAK